MLLAKFEFVDEDIERDWVDSINDDALELGSLILILLLLLIKVESIATLGSEVSRGVGGSSLVLEDKDPFRSGI